MSTMTAPTPQPSGTSYATAQGGYVGTDAADADGYDDGYDSSSEEGVEGADDEVSFVPLSMGCAEAALPEFLKVRGGAGLRCCTRIQLCMCLRLPGVLKCMCND
jgi:hypothetical protein